MRVGGGGGGGGGGAAPPPDSPISHTLQTRCLLDADTVNVVEVIWSWAMDLVLTFKQKQNGNSQEHRTFRL